MLCDCLLFGVKVLQPIPFSKSARSKAKSKQKIPSPGIGPRKQK
jgi:hypothetical protein